MHFLITAHDYPDSLDRRLSVRPAPLANLETIKGHIVLAGGILDEAGKPVGASLVLEFDTQEEVEHYLETEPYVTEGVWSTIRVEPFNTVILDNEKVGK